MNPHPYFNDISSCQSQDLADRAHAADAFYQGGERAGGIRRSVSEPNLVAGTCAVAIRAHSDSDLGADRDFFVGAQLELGGTRDGRGVRGLSARVLDTELGGIPAGGDRWFSRSLAGSAESTYSEVDSDVLSDSSANSGDEAGPAVGPYPGFPDLRPARKLPPLDEHC